MHQGSECVFLAGDIIVIGHKKKNFSSSNCQTLEKALFMPLQFFFVEIKCNIYYIRHEIIFFKSKNIKSFNLFKKNYFKKLNFCCLCKMTSRLPHGSTHHGYATIILVEYKMKWVINLHKIKVLIKLKIKCIFLEHLLRN